MQTKLLLISLLVLLGPTSAQADPTYTFAVIPQTSATKLAKDWMPLLEKVSRESGVKLKFVTASTITEFERRVVEAGTIDFGWANPLVYVTGVQTQGYVAFAKESKKKLEGLILVRADSPLKSLAELRGKRVAVPQGAFAAETLIKAELAKIGLTPGKDVEVKAVNSHDSAYLSVLSGQADAAGGVVRTLKAMTNEAQRNLRVLHRSEAVTPHPFFASSKVPAEVVARVQAALTKIGKDPSNAEILKNLNFADGFEVAADADYMDTRKIQALLNGPVATSPEPKVPERRTK